jgi:hypothetical protein
VATESFDRYDDNVPTSLDAVDLRTGRSVSALFPTYVESLPDTMTVSTNGTLAWLVRATAPSYDARITPALEDTPSEEVALVDVTGDGRLDVLTDTSNGFTVLPNRGNGTFAPARATYDLDVIGPATTCRTRSSTPPKSTADHSVSAERDSCGPSPGGRRRRA